MSEVGVVWWCSISFFKGVFLKTPLNTGVRTEFPFAPKEVCDCFLNPYTVVNIPTLFIDVT